MKIISFCNQNAYPPYEYLIKSAEKHGFIEDYEFVLYTVGFEVENPHPKVLYKSFFHPSILEKPEHVRRIKPSILIQSLKDFSEGEMLYLDTDHILGKRFNPKTLAKNFPSLTVPVAAHHCCNLRENWKGRMMWKVGEALGTKCDFTFTQTNIVLFSKESKNFLHKWEKLCSDSEYTTKLSFHDYPAGDEIVYNSILCEKNENLNLGQIHINLKSSHNYHFNAMYFGEEKENHFLNAAAAECSILNSSTIMLYHGCKDVELLNQHV